MYTSAGSPCMTFFFFWQQRIQRREFYEREHARSCADYIWVGAGFISKAGTREAIDTTALPDITSRCNGNDHLG